MSSFKVGDYVETKNTGEIGKIFEIPFPGYIKVKILGYDYLEPDMYHSYSERSLKLAPDRYKNMDTIGEFLGVDDES